MKPTNPMAPLHANATQRTITAATMAEFCQSRVALADTLEGIEQIKSAARAVHKAYSLLRPDSVGFGCLYEAPALTTLLRKFGYDASTVAGEAAWRTGAGDGDVIAHTPGMGGPGFAGHAWVLVPMGRLALFVDSTVAALTTKAAKLDAMDGKQTAVTWTPDVLAFGAFEGRPEAAMHADAAGAFAYRTTPEGMAVLRDVMQEDAETIALVTLAARQIMCGVQVVVIDETTTP